jgi:HTH-type transcriptional regulator/antitoxin HipB
MDIFELGLAVQAARLNKGITQAKLCAAVRIGRPTLSLFENGKLPEIGIRKVMELVEQLGMELTLIDAHGRPTLRDLQRENANSKVNALTKPTGRKRAPRVAKD